MKKTIQGDIKLLLVPLLILISIVILMLVSASIIVGKISSLNTDLTSANDNHTSLAKKLNSLQQIAPSISDDSVNLLAAVPGENSVVNAILTIRYQAAVLSLPILSLVSNSTTPIPGSPINTTQIDFQVSGTYANLFAFMEKIKNSAPIIHFSSVNIDNNDSSSDIYTLRTSVFSFWADLPSTIPSITEAIQQFTPEEQKIITNAASLEKPLAGTTNSESTPSAVGKTNPFQ